ncbi:RagB/SusD family nutrient uptake outer membrane protein [Sphingobacterium haloxyli]|uniref:RagB/SusD family nutrient uptake outer membrane protein n=1 Tax=Sphingobacterium haloxyli TaxID=2100533 RepID=A0A2S9J7H1_9SPHI|nr:RagB/SusD family nutrient uptake outer membrane protein [Sphingobacterium haloxyli]PRD48743.1 hypothetical protein C5745_02030 [Sphingobacterium haloxyli]
MLKKIIKKYIVLFVVANTAIMMQSCSDYLDRFPWDGPSDANYFANEDELMLAVNGLYSAMVYLPLDNMPTNLLLDNMTDMGWDRNNSAMQSMGRGDHNANNGFALTIWRESYRIIGKCNFVINNIDRLEGKIDEGLYNRTQSEARFIRAYTYSRLTDYYGSVPFLTENVGLYDAEIGKTNKETIVDFILQELEEIAPMLPATIPASEAGRASRAAALTLRARTALNNRRWEEAASSAKAVMDMDVHSLHSDYAELFTYAGQNSSEIIFAEQYLRTQNVQTHYINRRLASRNALGNSNKIPAQGLVDLFLCTDGLEIDKSGNYDPEKPFENRDPRLGYTIGVPGSIYLGYQFETHRDSTRVWNYNVTPAIRVPNEDATNAYATFSGYLWRKYVVAEDLDFPDQSELNIIQIRYAEVLLIYAEAMIELNRLDHTVYEALNAIRQRPTVNMPVISEGKTQRELRELVRKERVYELAMEGFRLMDLRRWELADKMMNARVYGSIQSGRLAAAPSIDEDGFVDYTKVPNHNEMRVVEVRTFNPARDYLWPIPHIETVTNPNLEQNPGY